MTSVNIGEKKVDLSKENIDELVSDFSRFYILTILYEGPTHGYKILNRFRKRLKKDISPSLVYPFLQRLESKGLVTQTVIHIGEKEKKVYELTEEGNELCNRLFKRFTDIASTAIEPSFNICGHCGCKLYESGYNETIDGEELTFCCKYCAASNRKERGKILKKLISRRGK
jgi:DNA-binding PadR family transcriptional regulator